MIPIFSERYGVGKPVVLIHGFCESSQIWRPLVNQLAFKNQVITLDLPGFGNSPLLQDSFSIEDIADQVHGWLKENDLIESILIGHSLGGYISLAIADKYPESIAAFGLLHSTAFADDADKKLSRDKTIDFITNNGIRVFADSFVKQLFYHKNRRRLDQKINNVIALVRTCEDDSVIAYLKAMRDRKSSLHVLKEFNKPILFISGVEDTAVPIASSRAQYDLISKPSITELQGVGHMGMYEATSECFAAVGEFLASLNKNDDSSSESGVLPNRDLKKNLGCG